MKTNRRKLLFGLGVAAGQIAAAPAQQTRPAERKGKPLDIADYEPKSMLHVPETHVEKARFPVVDVHTHLTSRGASEDTVRPTVAPEELLKVMDRRNIHTLVNLTGGTG